MKLRQRLKLLTFILIGLNLLSSCVPGVSKGGSTKAQCQNGFEFDSVKRACLATSTPQDAPVGTTTSATIVENSGANAIPISYTDFHNDPALSCSILSFKEGINDTVPTCTCITGICTANVTVDNDFSGVTDFSYVLSDNDGTSAQVLVAVTVTAVNNPPVANDYSFTVTENSNHLINFSALGLVTDPDGGVPTVTINTGTLYNGSFSFASGAANSTFTYSPAANTNDDNLLAVVSNENIIGGIRYVADPDFNSSSTSMTVTYIPAASASIGTVFPNLLTVFVVDDVTTDADVKALLDARPDIRTTAGIQYEILGSRPIDLGSPASTRSMTIENGRNLPNTFTYTATDSGGLSSTGTITVSVTPVDSIPDTNPSPPVGASVGTPAEPVTFSLVEGTASHSFNLPMANTGDHFIDKATQGLLYNDMSESGGNLSNCITLNGTDPHDISCTFTFTGSPTDADSHAQRIIGGLRYRALKKGSAGNSISITYDDSATNPIVVSGLVSQFVPNPAPTGMNVIISYDSSVHTSKDIKDAVEAAILSVGRSTTPTTPDDYDIEVLMLGSFLEAGAPIGPQFLAGGRENAAEFQYSVTSGVAVATQKITFDIPATVNDAPLAPAASGPFIGIPEDTLNHAITLGHATDPDITDELTYILDSTGLEGTITNCMDQTGSTHGADLTCSFTPNPEFSGTTSFKYNAYDGSLSGPQTTVSITVDPVADPPILCDYSHFSEAPECGERGCIGAGAPNSNNPITPATIGLRYYDSNAAACYISETGSTWRRLDPANSTDQGLFVADQVFNEKEVITIDQVRIDEGGNDSGVEDAEPMQVTAITSSNSILIPTSNIRFFYDEDDDGDLETLSDTTLPYDLADTGGANPSADFNDLRIEITPVGGQSGESDITITFSDSSATSVINFKVTVNPVSALHNGWKNITATGPKTNKFGQVKNPLNTCNYSRSVCNGECKGTSSPVGSITPTEDNALFLDTVTNKCYHLPDGAALNSSNWVEIVSNDNWVCNVSSSKLESGCSSLGASCIGTATPHLSITAEKANSFFFDKTAQKCYRSTQAGSNNWQEYIATSEVKLEWNSFLVSGSGSISGFNVFRKLNTPGATFDYNSPINRELLASTTSSFTDNAVNSFYAPVPQTVYFYEVRPVIGGISTNTTEGFKTVRVLTPPANKVFVHRWMVNQNICGLLQAGDIDPLNNYRCSYSGPGDSEDAASPGDYYYDIGSDLLVDRYEAGCNYSGSGCDTADGSCIGIGTPHLSVTSTGAGLIFYDRGSGKCYESTGASNNWTEYEDAAGSISSYNVAELPPLVHVGQERAHNFCQNASNDLSVANYIGLQGAAKKAQLPTRKMQIAYSQWDSSIDDSTLSNNEQGLSLNVSSKCNSASASGLSTSYTDTTVPSSNDLFSLPGTGTSGIRSMMTGTSELGSNKGTETCSSRYGAQDVVGNVKEWVAERLYCGFTTVDQEFSCQAMADLDRPIGSGGVGETWENEALALNGSISDDMIPFDGTDQYNVFRLDGIIGPCNGIDGKCNDSLTSWVIDEERFFASRWVIPMGLPAHIEFPNNNPSSVVAPFLKEIGPTSGITATQLRDDKMTFNNQLIRADVNSCGAMAAGGSYLDGTGAGVWSFEYTQCHDNDSGGSSGYLVNEGIYYRAKGATLVSLRIIVNPVASQALAITRSTVSGREEILVTLGTDASGNPNTTGAALAAALITDPDSNALVDTFIIGELPSIPNTLSNTPVDETTPYSRRVDIGFRCVTPIGDSDYSP